MSRPNPVDDAPPASTPQTPPPQDIGYGHPQYHFTQGLMELQKSFVKTETTLNALIATVEGMNNKIDDLVDWKSKIIGGAIALSAAIALVWAVFEFAADSYTITRKSDAIQNRNPQNIQQNK